MALFKHAARGVKLTEFFSRSITHLRLHFLLLLILSVCQHWLLFQLPFAYETKLLLSTVLFVASLLLLAALGYHSVLYAKGTAFSAVLAGGVYGGIAQLVGLAAYFAARGANLTQESAILSLVTAVLLGGLFSGFGGTIARIQTRFWL